MNNITKVNIVHKLEQNVCINNYKILPQNNAQLITTA